MRAGAARSLGTLLGATTMAVIQIGCAQKGSPNWVQQIVTGAIIVLAVALDRWRQGKAVTRVKITSTSMILDLRFPTARAADRAPTRCTRTPTTRPPT